MKVFYDNDVLRFIIRKFYIVTPTLMFTIEKNMILHLVDYAFE